MLINSSASHLPQIAVFASGQGSNALEMVRYFRESARATIGLVVSNKADAPVLEGAKTVGVPTLVIDKHAFHAPDDAAFDALEAFAISHIVLAGFLLLVPPNLILRYSHRILNLHPALLPKFGGKGMYGKYVHRAVLAAGEAHSGISIHEVNQQYDEGRILFQARCPVLPDDTPDLLAQRVRALEHRYLAPVVEAWALG